MYVLHTYTFLYVLHSSAFNYNFLPKEDRSLCDLYVANGDVKVVMQND